MKKVSYYLMLLPILGAVAAALIASCSPKPVEAISLNGSWNIISVDGKVIEGEEMPFIEFDMTTNKVHGNGGCNIFNSSVTLSKTNVSDLTLSPAAATMMACPNMDNESMIFRSLDKIASVKRADNANEMALVDKEGNILMVLKKK